MAASNKAKRTDYTLNGLRVYDLDPLASEIWACVGPDGADPRTLDPDNLPEGFRLIDGDEWDHAQDNHDEAEIVLYGQSEHWRESHYIGGLIDSALAAAGATGEEACCDIDTTDFDDLLDNLQCDVINFLEDRGYSVCFDLASQRHGVGVIVHRYRPEQQAIIEKALEAAVAASKPAYEERAAELVEALRREAEEKRDEQRIALFDEAVDLLRGAKEFLSAAVPYRTEIGSKLCDFLAKVAKD